MNTSADTKLLSCILRLTSFRRLKWKLGAKRDRLTSVLPDGSIATVCYNKAEKYFKWECREPHTYSFVPGADGDAVHALFAEAKRSVFDLRLAIAQIVTIPPTLLK